MIGWFLHKLVGIDLYSHVCFTGVGEGLAVHLTNLPDVTPPTVYVVFYSRHFVISNAKRYAGIVVCESLWIADLLARLGATWGYGLDEFDRAAITDKALIARYGVLPVHTGIGS